MSLSGSAAFSQAHGEVDLLPLNEADFGPTIRVFDADNSLDTYAAIRAAACVVTMNSQAGIEAAALGVPTIVSARAHFARCGFTFDGSTPVTLADSLRACLAASHEERLRRRRIAVDFVGTLRDRVFVPRTAAAIAGVIARVVHHGMPRDGNS